MGERPRRQGGAGQQDQHIISAWLLRRFAGATPAGPRLSTFDKLRGRFGSSAPRRFLVGVNTHPREIETELSRVEGLAAEATRRLVERAVVLEPGLCLLDRDIGGDVVEPSAAPADGGVVENFRLAVVQRRLSAPRASDTAAIARFVALMYVRAPKMHAIAEAAGRSFADGVGLGMRLYGQPLTPEMQTELESVRQRSLWRGVEMANSISGGLTSRQWWLLKASHEQPFILGDSPVVATLAVGHDDDWRPLLSESSYVVAMPLDPSVALVIARFIPGAGSSLTEVEWVNFLSWKWADRYAVARGRNELEAVKARFEASGWTADSPASLDQLEARGRGVRLVTDTILRSDPPRFLLRTSLARVRQEAQAGARSQVTHAEH